MVKAETDLQPISPQQALDLYLKERRTEVTDSTIKAHEYRLSHFIKWCEQEGIENLNTLTGRQLHEYKLWRREDGDLSKVSVKTQMDTLRVFIRYCETIDAVSQDLSDKVLSPTLDDGDNQSNAILRRDGAETLLAYLQDFEYATFDHTLLLLFWKTGMRIGAAHALDVEDYHPDEQYVEVRHRPSTPLKNKEAGERLVALSPETCTVLDDWIEHKRPEVTDDEERVPLFASQYGRAHKNTLRWTVYRWTRPCQYGEGCPHDRDPETCVATDEEEKAFTKCPSSVAPHAIRRGAITHHLTEDIPERVVSDRMNVSQRVLDAHYDKRSEEVKMEQRREFLSDL